MAYGEPRLTNDIDIVADLNLSHLPGLMEAFPPDEFTIDEEMIREAVKQARPFNIIHPASGLKVDIIIKMNTPFDRSRFERIRRIYPGPYPANFASPEDVIIKKMEYYQMGGSEKHLRDITGILKISGETVDKEYIASWAGELGFLEIWEAVLKKLEGQEAK